IQSRQLFKPEPQCRPVDCRCDQWRCRYHETNAVRWYTHVLMWKCAILFAILMGCAFAEQPSDPLAEGIALLQKGEFQRSLIVLRRAVEQKPKSAPAHN